MFGSWIIFTLSSNGSCWARDVSRERTTGRGDPLINWFLGYFLQWNNQLIHTVMKLGDCIFDALVVGQILLSSCRSTSLFDDLRSTQHNNSDQLSRKRFETLPGDIFDTLLGIEFFLTMRNHFLGINREVNIPSAKDHDCNCTLIHLLEVAFGFTWQGPGPGRGCTEGWVRTQGKDGQEDHGKGRCHFRRHLWSHFVRFNLRFKSESEVWWKFFN